VKKQMMEVGEGGFQKIDSNVMSGQVGGLAYCWCWCKEELMWERDNVSSWT